MIDIDGFKDVNDGYGQCCGDQVCASLPNACELLFVSGTSWPLRGDEFVVIAGN
jgi:GGDEF domain-containing protein